MIFHDFGTPGRNTIRKALSRNRHVDLPLWIAGPLQRWRDRSLCDSLQILLTKSQHIASLFPPKKEAEMRVIIPTLVGLAALVATSVQAAPTPSKAYPHGKWHETPAQNVWKSQRYDYLLSSNAAFRSSRVRKECGPIKDPALRNDCVGSFSAYEPMR